MSASNIKAILARQIIDSRGYPTVEADVHLKSGHVGRASVPSGASTGKREALELRDHNPNVFLGKSVHKALASITDHIQPVLKGMDASDQLQIDQALLNLDGSPNKHVLGANAMLAVSMACMRAVAALTDTALYELFPSQPLLPIPMMNLINGGAHADNNLDVQEFMIVPHGFDTFSRSLRAGCEVFHHLKMILNNKNLSTAVGDEGGFAPNLENNAMALDFILMAIEKAGYKPAQEISIALDVAASEFYKDNKYVSQKGTELCATGQDMVAYYEGMLERYPIVSIEDGLSEDDWDGWQNLTETLGDRCQLVGDDLLVTNPSIVQEAIDKNIANAVLIKINQIGTITETLQTLAIAKAADYRTVISHRSGETEDTFIADLAVGSGAGQIKTGSVSRSERNAKYNELLRIEESLGSKAMFAQDIF